jgi:hypothetical protein
MILLELIRKELWSYRRSGDLIIRPFICLHFFHLLFWGSCIPFCPPVKLTVAQLLKFPTFCVHKSLSPFTLLSQINSIQTLQHGCHKFYFNIILPPVPWSFDCYLAFRLPNKNILPLYFLPRLCCMFQLPFPVSYGHPKYSFWTVITVANLRFHKRTGNFLTSWATVSFSRRTIHVLIHVITDQLKHYRSLYFVSLMRGINLTEASIAF